MEIIVTSRQDLEAIVNKVFQDNLQQLSLSISSEQPAEIINTEELCKKLRITEPTVIRYRKRNKIPFLQLGASIRYNWPEVLKALDSLKKTKRYSK